MIYLLTVNYHSARWIEKLIASLSSGQEGLYQVIIVNNSPEDASIYRFKDGLTTILESAENLGFGRACNLGIDWVYRQNPQAIIWLINPDAYLLEDALPAALEFFSHYPEVSILGTAVFEPNREVWFGGGQFNPKTGEILEIKNLSPELASVPYQVMDWVTGCSLLINLKNFTTSPYFDSDYFLYYEDFEFCQRYRKQGHIVGLTAKFSAIHIPSSITGKNQDLKQQHSIYSYLLSLDKHACRSALLYRLARITFTALISLPFNYRISTNKLKGVLTYARSQLIQIGKKS